MYYTLDIFYCSKYVVIHTILVVIVWLLVNQMENSQCVCVNNNLSFLTWLFLLLFVLGHKQPEENRALRLKSDRYALMSADDQPTNRHVDSSPSSLTDGQSELFTPFSTLSSYLDETAYVAAGGLRPGDDAYSRNKFNQLASDSLRSNRPVPDTRNSK